MSTDEAADLQPFPFALPHDFLTRLGYERAVDAPLPITDALRDQLRREFGQAGLEAFEASVAARRPRRWLALFCESAGDELGWTDGQSGGAGQLAHWPSSTWSTGHRSTAGWSSIRSIWAAPRPRAPTRWLSIGTLARRGSRRWPPPRDRPRPAAGEIAYGVMLGSHPNRTAGRRLLEGRRSLLCYAAATSAAG